MKNDELIVLALAGIAVFLIVKSGGITLPKASGGAALNVDLWSAPWYDYNYQNDEDGAKFSATGADVRARR